MAKQKTPPQKIDTVNLFFDSETTGLPDKDHRWERDYMNYPYILSFAWRYKSVSHYYLIYQEGRKVPKAATEINGITTEMANNLSVTKPFEWVMNAFIKDSLDAVNIIGHNVYFDVSITKANILRHFGVDSEHARTITEALDKEKRIDTMRSSKILFNNKWPKLTQLHEYLFNKPFAAHDAMEDVLACERCYFELKKRRII